MGLRRRTEPTRPFRALFVVLLGTAGLAGCITADEMDQAAPVADLEIGGDAQWAGSPVRFDVAGSHDPNGEIETFQVDFGDGTTEEYSGDAADRIEHVYPEGGVYQVTLTVVDDGSGQDAAREATDAETVTVHERTRVDTGVLVATPEPDDTSTHTEEVSPGTDATGVEVDLEVEGLLVVGTSELVIRLLGANDTSLAEENVTVAGDTTENVHLFSPVHAADNLTLEIQAVSGSAQANGTITLYYGALEEVPTTPTEPPPGNNTTLRVDR